MMKPSRIGMRAARCLEVDSEFCTHYSSQLFKHSGERTQNYDEIEQEVKLILKDLDDDLKIIRAEIDATL